MGVGLLQKIYVVCLLKCWWATKRPDEKDDTVDNNETKDNTLDGILVEYNQDEIALFNYLGDIWVGTE